jgi:hypothetical protein
METPLKPERASRVVIFAQAKDEATEAAKMITKGLGIIWGGQAKGGD